MFNWLKQRIVDVIKWFADIFIAIFKALWDLVTDLFSWVFDQLMGLVVSALSAIDLGGLNNYNPQTGFTSEMLNIMGLLKDRKSTRLNSSHLLISYAVFCLKKKKSQPQH